MMPEGRGSVSEDQVSRIFGKNDTFVEYFLSLPLMASQCSKDRPNLINIHDTSPLSCPFVQVTGK